MSLKINRFLPMATISMHMKFETEIPKQTWLMLRKPCCLQTDGRTDGRTDKVNPVYSPPPPTSLGWGIMKKVVNILEARDVADNIFKCMFINVKLCIFIQISLKFVPQGHIDNESALVQVMACRLTGIKPLTEQMLTWFTDTHTVYPKKYAHGFCFAVLCCGYTLTDFPISIRLTSLALWQSNDCPSASKATLMNMDKYFMWIHYERLHNHNKAKHNKTVCIFLGIYCMWHQRGMS